MLDFAATELRVREGAGRIVLRAGGEAAAHLSDVFGVTLPLEILTGVIGATRSAAKLGPDEWLLMCEREAVGELIAALSAAAPCSAVDVSDRQITIEVDGTACEWLINEGCPLDLSLLAFPPGRVTRTLLGKAEVVLWRKSVMRFDVEVWRSFASYCRQRLELARAG